MRFLVLSTLCTTLLLGCPQPAEETKAPVMKAEAAASESTAAAAPSAPDAKIALDASTSAAFAASLDAFSASLASTQRGRFRRSVEFITRQEAAVKPAPGTPVDVIQQKLYERVASRVNGMTAAQVIAEMESQLKAKAAPKIKAAIEARQQEIRALKAAAAQAPPGQQRDLILQRIKSLEGQ